MSSPGVIVDVLPPLDYIIHVSGQPPRSFGDVSTSLAAFQNAWRFAQTLPPEVRTPENVALFGKARNLLDNAAGLMKVIWDQAVLDGTSHLLSEDISKTKSQMDKVASRVKEEVRVEAALKKAFGTVSYTHLTLPTIYSV